MCIRDSNLRDVLSKQTLDGFVQLTLSHSTVDGNLVQLPRHSDVSNLYYMKNLYDDSGNQRNFKAKFGYDLTPPDTWKEVKDHAIFFADPPNFYGTQFVGKDEANYRAFL